MGIGACVVEEEIQRKQGSRHMYVPLKDNCFPDFICYPLMISRDKKIFVKVDRFSS